MTQEQQQQIEAAWTKLRSTTQRVQQADEDYKSASLAGAPPERLQELDHQRTAAIQADAAALDEVESALRSAGLNV